MAKTHYTLDPAQRSLPLLFMAGLLSLAAFQHMIVLYLVFPVLSNNLLQWIVPSRYGNGTNSLLNADEFATLSLSFMAVMGVLFILTAVFIRAKKYLGAMISFILFAGVALIFFPLTFGNVFGDLWNGWAALIGVLLALAIVLLSEVPVFRTFKTVKK